MDANSGPAAGRISTPRCIDGAHQLGTISGSVADGLTVELAVPVQTA